MLGDINASFRKPEIPDCTLNLDDAALDKGLVICTCHLDLPIKHHQYEGSLLVLLKTHES